MSDYIDTTVRDIDSRLHELQEEVARLRAARAALIGDGKRSPGRPRGSADSPAGTNATTATATPGRRRARAGGSRGTRDGGTRSSQALDLVRRRPGITIPQLADELGIGPNYLYRVMPKLAAEGLVVREGLGYHANSEPEPAAQDSGEEETGASGEEEGEQGESGWGES